MHWAVRHGSLRRQGRALFHFFFFFQAEDGIRDLTVTGVQTCALPISAGLPVAGFQRALPRQQTGGRRLARRVSQRGNGLGPVRARRATGGSRPQLPADRKSTRLNSSHSQISYAVFCLKKTINTPRSTI